MQEERAEAGGGHFSAIVEVVVATLLLASSGCTEPVAGADAGATTVDGGGGQSEDAGVGADGGGRIDAGSSADAGTASTDAGTASIDASSGDAGPTQPCDLGAPFIVGPRVSADLGRVGFSETLLTWMLGPTPGCGPGDTEDRNAVVARRSTIDSGFGSFEQLDGVFNRCMRLDDFPWISANGLVILTSYSGPGVAGDYDIHRASRSSASDAFGDSVPLPARINTAATQTNAIENEHALYYVEAARGTEETRIRRSRRLGGDYADPLELAELRGPTGVESWPVVSADDLTIYFASTRTDTGVGRGTEIWMARRATGTVPFGDPVPLGELNDTGPNVPVGLSDDECRIYFYGNPSGLGLGVYLATRP